MGADSRATEREARCSINRINAGSQVIFIVLKYAWLMSWVEVPQPARTHEEIPPGWNWISRSRLSGPL